MINNINLHLNGIVANNKYILYEIKNLSGEKRYFIHCNIESIELSTIDKIDIVKNDVVRRELIRIHNDSVAKLVNDKQLSYKYDFFIVDGLMLLVDRTDETIMKWVNNDNSIMIQ